MIRGSHGEIVDDRGDPAGRPADAGAARRSCAGRPARPEPGRLRPRAHQLRRRVRLPQPVRRVARLADDDIAVAALLEQTGAWARGDGPPPYPLADACQDHPIGLAIGESAAPAARSSSGASPGPRPAEPLRCRLIDTGRRLASSVLPAGGSRMSSVELSDRDVPDSVGGPKPLLSEPVPRWVIAFWRGRRGAVPGAPRRRPDRVGLGSVLVGHSIAVVVYLVSGFGVTVGFHRYFTHGAFKAQRLAAGHPRRRRVAGDEGAPIHWVADHRRHHAFADREGDPHSPWRYGATAGAGQGTALRPLGWLFQRETTNRARFAPDLLADRDIRRVDRLVRAAGSWSRCWLPPLLGGLLTWSWYGRADRVLLGQPRPHRAAAPRHLVDQLDLPRVRQRRSPPAGRPAANFWPLAIISFGRELAQLPPRRPDLRPPRCAARAARPVRPADPLVRAGRLGLRRPLAVPARLAAHSTVDTPSH